MDVWEVPYSSCPPALTKASSWMSDLSTLGIWVCTRRSNGPRKERYGSAARVTCWPDAQAQQWAGRVSDESGKSLPAPAGCCSDRFGVVAEPVLETCRAKARIIAGGEALIVHRIAVVERLGIGDYRPWVPGCVQESPHEVVLADRFGTGQFDGAIQRLGEGHTATTAATSSDAMGCIMTGGRRAVCPSVANWAMAPTNSKKCVART